MNILSTIIIVLYRTILILSLAREMPVKTKKLKLILTAGYAVMLLVVPFPLATIIYTIGNTLVSKKIIETRMGQKLTKEGKTFFYGASLFYLILDIAIIAISKHFL